MEIIVYFTGSIFFIAALLFVYYTFRNAYIFKKGLGHKAMAVGAITSILSLVPFTINYFSPTNLPIMGFSGLSLWVAAAFLITVGGIIRGRDIQKVHKAPLLNIVFIILPNSKFYFIGIVALVFIGLPFNVVSTFFGAVQLDWMDVVNVSSWAFCFVNLVIGEAILYYITSPIEIEKTMKRERLPLKDDIVATLIYTDLINNFISASMTRWSSHIVNDVLSEWVIKHPVLFDGCHIDNKIDVSTVLKNCGRIDGTDRLNTVLKEFSSLLSHFVKIYSAATSATYANKVLEDTFISIRESYGRTSVIFDILRSLPDGVLETHKLALLSKEELESKVESRTIELRNALEKLSKERETAKKLAELEHQRAMELKKANEEIEKQREYSDSIIRSMIDTLIVVTPDGKIRTINRATEDLLGYKADELVGKPVATIFEEEEIPFKGTRLKKLLENGAITQYAMTYKAKDGEKIPVSFSGSVMRDKQGNLLGIIGIARDTRELKRFTEKLIETSKMTALGQFVAGAAHEINNPLSIITMATQNLLSKFKKASPEALTQKELNNLIEHLEMINRQCMRCSDITHSLLTFAGRGEQIEKVPMSVNKVIGEALRIMGHQLQLSKIKIIDKRKPLPKVLGNSSRLTQVFMNLILNARQSMPKGGNLIIRTFKIGDKIRIEITDTGEGISKENLDRVFEPFFTTRKTGEGTGLGLSIAYSIIKEHGGDIEIESKLGKGTKVIITLPVIQP
ncbi:MAG: ATP-binding protein [bacterium]|nr:ATP-binding protein [bacterium]